MIDPLRLQTLLDRLAHEIAGLHRLGRRSADAFAVLAEAALLDAGLADSLRATARFRNLLVHGYAQIDDRQVVKILQTRVDDLESFRFAAARLAT
jgi:uncharacterized protein YutE (UPF0331/DUF86 family)